MQITRASQSVLAAAIATTDVVPEDREATGADPVPVDLAGLVEIAVGLAPVDLAGHAVKADHAARDGQTTAGRLTGTVRHSLLWPPQMSGWTSFLSRAAPRASRAR